MGTAQEATGDAYERVKTGIWDEIKPWLQEQDEQYGNKEAYLLAEYCTAVCLQLEDGEDTAPYVNAFKTAYREEEAGKPRSGQDAVDEFFEEANERLNGTGPLEPP